LGHAPLSSACARRFLGPSRRGFFLPAVLLPVSRADVRTKTRHAARGGVLSRFCRRAPGISALRGNGGTDEFERELDRPFLGALPAQRVEAPLRGIHRLASGVAA